MSDSIKPEVTSRATVFDNTWMRVVRKEGAGFPSPYYVVDAADYVTVLAVTDDDKVALVRQYRPALEDWSLELPSGHVDAGETPAAAAAREVREETGFDVRSVELLGPLAPNTGRFSNRLWAFYARVGAQTGSPEAGVELVLTPLSEVRRLVARGTLAHALDLAVYVLARAHGRLMDD